MSLTNDASNGIEASCNESKHMKVYYTNIRRTLAVWFHRSDARRHNAFKSNSVKREIFDVNGRNTLTMALLIA
jgi:hypothetical protein